MNQGVSSSKSTEPSWLTNPSYMTGDKRAAVGCAKIHVRGESAQRKLAIERAVSEIALQKKSKVSVVDYRNKIVNSAGSSSSSLSSSSLHEVDSINVSTAVKGIYKRVRTGEICAWVVEK